MAGRNGVYDYGTDIADGCAVPHRRVTRTSDARGIAAALRAARGCGAALRPRVLSGDARVHRRSTDVPQAPGLLRRHHQPRVVVRPGRGARLPSPPVGLTGAGTRP